MHSTGMACFKGLESHLTTLYPISDFFNEEVLILFDSAFLAFFSEEHQTFRMKMFHNLDQLQLQFKRENLHAVNTKTCLEVLRTQFKEFFASKGKAVGKRQKGTTQRYALSKSLNETQKQMQEGKIDMVSSMERNGCYQIVSGTNQTCGIQSNKQNDIEDT
ncbi:hypothetical protein Tco_1337778 [Tanacetum coccineum]